MFFNLPLSARLRRSWKGGGGGGFQWCQQSTSMHFQALRSCAKLWISWGRSGEILDWLALQLIRGIEFYVHQVLVWYRAYLEIRSPSGLVLHVNLTFALFSVVCTNCSWSVWKLTRRWCMARANRAENKRYCKTRVYMKYHPNGNIKNIMVFSALAKSVIYKCGCYIQTLKQ